MDFLKMSLQDLGRVRDELLAKVNTLAETPDTEFTEELQAELDDLTGQVQSINKVISARNRKNAALASVANITGVDPRSTANNTFSAPVISNVRPLWEDDPNKGFATPKDFLSAVMNAGLTGKVPENLAYLSTAGSDEQSGINDQYGGYSIPEGHWGRLISTAPEADPIAPLTTKVPMQTPIFKIDALVDKNHSTSVTGGLRIYRRIETEDVPSSRVQMEQIELKVNSMMGVSYATMELLSDSPYSWVALIAQFFGREAASKLIDERINGTGVGMYEGVLQNPALITVAKETGQAAGSVVLKNIVKMYARQYDKNNAIWLANHNVLPALMELNQSVGTGGVPAWQPSARDGVPNMLFGRPIYFHEALPSVGTAGDLCFISWANYVEGSLGGETFAESIHVRFLNNENCFRFVARNDGRGLWRSALTPKNGDTLSPFVALGARA